MDYTELETAIQDYCQNSETSFVSHINEFIISAEDKAFFVMDGAQYFKTSTSAPTVSGQHYYESVDGMPSGLLDITGIRLCETPSGNIETGGPMRYLQVRDYDFLWEAYPGTVAGPETGIPKYYAVKQTTQTIGLPYMSIFLFPQPDDVYNTEIEYMGKAVTDSITYTNTPGGGATTETWLSVVLPDVLLYGALVQAYTYMKGEADIMAGYEKQFMESLLMLQNMTEKRQDTDKFKANTEGAS